MPPEAQHTSLGSYYHSRQREMIHSPQAAFFFSNFFPPAARWREEPLVTGYFNHIIWKVYSYLCNYVTYVTTSILILSYFQLEKLMVSKTLKITVESVFPTK